jgi:hypothetical protein
MNKTLESEAADERRKWSMQVRREYRSQSEPFNKPGLCLCSDAVSQKGV